MHRLTHALDHQVAIVYASSALADEIGLPGTISPPSFDITRFFGHAVIKDGAVRQRFTIGRASRDVRYKHHVDDLDLYGALLKMGCEIELVGATSIADRLPGHPALNVSPEIPQSALPGFLDRLDCFVYRTSPRKPEGFGLCIVEAMAAGLPVVAARHGGYVDIINSGVNGFLFDTNEEAVSIVTALKENPDLRTQIGISARRSISALVVR
jgi:glycosyltransferase involved in cell wall biosynthesis